MNLLYVFHKSIIIP